MVPFKIRTILYVQGITDFDPISLKDHEGLGGSPGLRIHGGFLAKNTSLRGVKA